MRRIVWHKSFAYVYQKKKWIILKLGKINKHESLQTSQLGMKLVRFLLGTVFWMMWSNEIKRKCEVMKKHEKKDKTTAVYSLITDMRQPQHILLSHLKPLCVVPALPLRSPLRIQPMELWGTGLAEKQNTNLSYVFKYFLQFLRRTLDLKQLGWYLRLL